MRSAVVVTIPTAWLALALCLVAVAAWWWFVARPLMAAWQRRVDRFIERRYQQKLHELKFGPRSYTPEQAEVIERSVRERRPLDAPALPLEPAEGQDA